MDKAAKCLGAVIGSSQVVVTPVPLEIDPTGENPSNCRISMDGAFVPRKMLRVWHHAGTAGFDDVLT